VNIPTLTETNWTARLKWLEYAKAVRARWTDEDDLLRATYRSIALGQRVLDIRQVMRGAGVDALGRPVLAIARADKQRVAFGEYSGGGHYRAWAFIACGHFYLRPRMDDTFLGRPTFVMSNDHQRWYSGHNRLSALVPLIPPALRPAPEKLPQFHILWEADWDAAPKDPLLLRRVRGPMFAIVAQWDLTEVERAVLQGRLGG